MSLTPEQSGLLKTLYGTLDPFEPLKPSDPRYEPIYGDGRREDPVERLATHIEWSKVESLQLFSGFRGSGKTTELFRLQERLRNQGDVVIYANALEYLNPAEPIDITDLVLALTGAFGDGLEALKILDVPMSVNGGVWKRFTDYLRRTSLSVPEATIHLEGDSPAKEVLGGLNAGLELKVALRETGSFRQRLREFLGNRLGELKAEANRFVEERVRAIQKARGSKVRVVFIFDQLEQLRGSASNEGEVIRSVERVFGSHFDKLKFPYVHAIYSVPPWLQFVLPGGVDVEVLATFQLWKNDEKRSPYASGMKLMRQMVRRRLESEGMEAVFGKGATGQARVDRLIEACGGHFRDLFRLLRELLVRLQTQQKSLPAKADSIDEAIQRVREQYLPLSEDDARRLDRIAKTRACVLADSSPAEATTASRLLDLHLVLYFSNGEEWYDVHPLIRDEIGRVVRRVVASS
jgi:hypothetical protein